MSKIVDEIRNIENNENLKHSLSDFTNKIFTDKKLSFPTSDYSFDESLIENGILKNENEAYAVLNYHIVAYYLWERYKRNLDFETKANFKENVEFLKKIKDDFNSNNYVHYFHLIEEGLWRIVITEANHYFQCDFHKYLTSVNKDNNSDEMYAFIEAYSFELANLNISLDILHKNSILLLEFAKSDATYNLPLGSILNGIKQKCKTDYTLGLQLFELAINQPEANEQLISSTVSGLYEIKREAFYDVHLKSKIDSEKYLPGIITGLSTVTNIGNNESQLFLHLYDTLKSHPTLSLRSLTLLISILKAPHFESKEKYAKEVFARLQESVKEENAYFILHNITYTEGYNEERSDLIVTLIEQEYFAINKYLKAIEHVFWHLDDIDSFKKIILAIIKERPFERISQHLNSPLQKIQKVELDKFLIELLTYNEASKRFIGLDLFNKLSTFNPYIFSVDILSLSPIIQYRLWVSMTQDYKEPKYTIPSILSLVESKSDLVKESFVCKLEELSEDYGGHIIEVLETYLDKQNIEHRKVLDRVRDYMNSFYSTYIDIKRPIKELNPYYTDNKAVRLFNELHFKKMSETIHKGAEKNSFLSVLGVDTVQLSKGGGFRFGNKREISKLGSFASSFSLPRSYFINDNNFELEKGFETRRDWTDQEFETIQTFIDNEQQ